MIIWIINLRSFSGIKMINDKRKSPSNLNFSLDLSQKQKQTYYSFVFPWRYEFFCINDFINTSNSWQEKWNTNRCVFHLTNNKILQIGIPTKRKLEISENVKYSNSSNNSSSFNFPSSLEMEKVVRNLFLNCSWPFPFRLFKLLTDQLQFFKTF